MPITKNRVIRIPDFIWDAAKATAEQAGETVTAAVIRALVNYVADPPSKGSMRRASSRCPRCGTLVGRQRTGGAALARHYNDQDEWCE